MVRIALITVFGVLCATPALASSDIDTCLTVAGVLTGPWTDGVDPACGADCPDLPDEGLCDLLGECPIAPAIHLKLPAPQPPAPLCLKPGPTCQPDNSGGLLSTTHGPHGGRTQLIGFNRPEAPSVLPNGADENFPSIHQLSSRVSGPSAPPPR